ncbi:MULTISPECIES: PIG-L family deacetylase [Amycolatopsis]|uniref:GlcNAc-PI de-N-acetylase n=2 Tax=Amycolatopsis TaxID=1813 RepID=A0A1I3T1I1_9PSEU|nr:PIG-L family deacetylase [Amycolatopsis sacchari]SFJ64934.1 GlcNAc-PI de-N-acetylase [Amycolatopsis sacchari]
MAHSFYFAAHADDALLFRGNQLFADEHTRGAQVVHVTTTGGDAGRTDGWWQAREQGLVDALNATAGDPPVTTETITLGGRALTRYRAANWFLYPLRLPDGGLDGQGFGLGSLTMLRDGRLGALTPLDGSTPYQGWPAVVATLRAIVAGHRDSGETPWLNVADPDPARNPGDHPDHYATAAAADAIADADRASAWFWTGYDTKNRPANLDGLALEAKRFLFAAYGWRTGGPDETEWGWWGPRDYGRVR